MKTNARGIDSPEGVETHRGSTAKQPEPADDGSCAKCGRHMDIPVGYEPTAYCNECAQVIAAAAVQPSVEPLTEARIEQLAVASGLYSGNPRTPGTGNMILRRLRRFVELIEAERVRGIGAVPLSKAQDVHQERRLDGGVRTDAGGQSSGEDSQ